MWHQLRVLAGALLLAGALVQTGNAQVLISESEAMLPPASDAGMATRGITRGPGIDLVSPGKGAQNLSSPVALKIRFMARNNVAIDPASVKLTYLRKPSVDLTSRVKPFLSKDGIDMAKAEVPPGRHLIRIDVKDTEGRSGSSTITLTVAPK
jgi:hypothetical protein